MDVPQVNVVRSELPNGLTLLVAEQHYAEVASVQVWCETGSIHENQWLGAGLTHLLEHMLFKGTSSRSALQISEEIHQVGAYINAYTSFERTVFWVDCPTPAVEKSVEILADMLFHSVIDPEEVKREMEVVRREFAMGLDDPDRTLSQLMFGTAYQVHPCRFPVIGVRELFDQITHEALLRYHRERYAVNNIFVVISGDVKAEEVHQLVERYFGPAKPVPLRPLTLPAEPVQVGRREGHKLFPGDLAYFGLAWHAPPVWSPDTPALDLASIIIGGGASSVLYESLRERSGLVYGIGAFAYTPNFPGLITISGTCAPDVLEQVEEEVLQKIRAWTETKTDEGQLDKAKRIISVSAIEQLQTVKGVGTDVGLNWLYTRNTNFSQRYLEQVRSTRAEEVVAAVQRHLQIDNLNFSSLQPKQEKRSHRKRPRSESELELVRLENGLRAVLIPDERLPLLHASVVFRGGVLVEDAQRNGMSRLYSQALLKGTQNRSALEIAEQIEALGGTLFGDSGYNSFRVATSSLSDDFAQALELVGDILTAPSFPEDAVERERTSQLATIQAEGMQPTVVARNLLRSEIYRKHPYATNVLGTPQSVAQLTRDDLLGVHRQCATGPGAVMAVCGRFRREEVLDWLEHSLGSLPGGATSYDLQMPTVAPLEARTVFRRDTRNQAVITIGYLVCSLYDPDRVPLEILDEATGDSSSRFFTKVREELGMAYSVGTSLMPGLAPGIFCLYAATAPELVEEVLNLCQTEVALLADGGLTEREFERAKVKLLAQFAFQKQSLDGYAHGIALNELYGLGINYFQVRQQQIRATTIEDVRRVCLKYLMDKPSITVIVSP